MIRVYDTAGNLIETHEHAGEVQKNGEFIFAPKTPRLLSIGAQAPHIRFRGRWRWSRGRVGFARARDQH
jgi:hypothetical protein